MDIWGGIKALKRNYQPIPYSKVDKAGQHVPKHMQAEMAARHFATVQWGKQQIQDEQNPREQIRMEEAPFDTNAIHITELRAVLKKFKRRKAAGPDGIPMVCPFEMNHASLCDILKLLNEWCETQNIPTEVLRAESRPNV